MTSQPDKLFREKLENFQRPAPAAAWDRIEKNLSKPSRTIIWLRIAAGVAILATAAVLVWPSGKNPEALAETKNKPVVTPVDTVKEPELRKEDTVNKQQTPGKKKIVRDVVPTINHQPVAKVETPVQKSKQVVKDSIAIAIDPVSQPKELVAEIVTPVKAEPSNTIVYTNREVNAKFLKKKLSPEATPEDKDASGIQKLIGLAYAAKNSEGGLADLRQKKDDFLALSFGKKKSEN